MEKYCQRCGKKIMATAESCPFCGVHQDRLDLGFESKKCKVCHEIIPVNANYCTECGQDQAIYVYRPAETFESEKQILPEPETISMLSSGQDLQVELEKIRQEVLRMEQIGKNENSQPGLVVSTKLMLKEWFTTNKRMGRADFWWGMLGMVLLSFGVVLVAMLFLQSMPTQTGLQIFWFILRCWSLYYLMVTAAGVIRRLHDLELPGLLVFIYLIPVIGEIMILLLLTRPQVLTENNRYGFIDPARKIRDEIRKKWRK